MTDEEIFCKVADHLMAQGEQSAPEGRPCFYRGPNGLKCAVGALISDDFYRPELEGNLVCKAVVREALEASLGVRLGSPTLGMLEELQDIHDSDDPDSWAAVLIAMAQEWGFAWRPKP